MVIRTLSREDVPQYVWNFWERIYELTAENTQRGPRACLEDLHRIAQETADKAVQARYGIAIGRG